MTNGTLASRRAPKTGEATRTAAACLFTVGKRTFALDVGIVQEVLAVETLLAVPMAHPTVRGLLTLRGALVSVADLNALLELAEASEPPAVALIVRHAEGPVALLVDSVDGVVHPDEGARTAKIEGDDPRIAYFLRLGATTIPVLDTAHLVGRLESARFAQTAGSRG